MKQFLKKTKRFIMHYWLSISLGMIATPFAIQYAYQDRETAGVRRRVSGITGYGNGCVSASTGCTGNP